MGEIACTFTGCTYLGYGAEQRCMPHQSWYLAIVQAERVRNAAPEMLALLQEFNAAWERFIAEHPADQGIEDPLAVRVRALLARLVPQPAGNPVQETDADEGG